MEKIRQWAMVLCTAAVAISVVQLAAPEGKTAKAFRCLTSLFFLVCLISPLRTGKTTKDSFYFNDKWEETLSSGQELSEKVDEQILALGLENLEKTAEEMLNEKGINAEKILMHGHFTQEGGISINSAEIILPLAQKDKADFAQDLIREAFRIPVHLTINEEIP